MLTKMPKCPMCGRICTRVQRKVKGGYRVAIFCPTMMHTFDYKNRTLYVAFYGDAFSKSKEKAKGIARSEAFRTFWSTVNDFIAGVELND